MTSGHALLCTCSLRSLLLPTAEESICPGQGQTWHFGSLRPRLHSKKFALASFTRESRGTTPRNADFVAAFSSWRPKSYQSFSILTFCQRGLCASQVHADLQCYVVHLLAAKSPTVQQLSLLWAKLDLNPAEQGAGLENGRACGVWGTKQAGAIRTEDPNFEGPVSVPIRLEQFCPAAYRSKVAFMALYSAQIVH